MEADNIKSSERTAVIVPFSTINVDKTTHRESNLLSNTQPNTHKKEAYCLMSVFSGPRPHSGNW